VFIRVMAFILSAVLAGLAGSIFATISNFISPESFPFFQSIVFLLVVIIGGVETVLGPVIGAIIVVLLPEFLSFLAEYRLLFVGVLLLVILLVTPDGVAGTIGRWLVRPDERKVRAGTQDIRAFLAARGSGQALTIEDLRISFGGVHAVAGVSLTARAGEITSIIGPNGAGKTTLLNLMGGFYKPDAGAVKLGARDLTGLPSHALARAGVGRTYQTTQLFSRMSVLDNLLIALRRGRLGSIFSALFRPLRDQPKREMVESLLAFVGYDGPLHQPAGALPHVDKRLVEIARALATQPSVLLLDEPAAGLGRGDTERVAGLLRRIAEAGIAVVLVEHDMSLVMSVSDRVVVLDAGARISEGTPAEVRNDPAVRKAYLGAGAVEGTGRAPGWRGSEDIVLAVDKVSAGYGAAPVLNDIELTVHSGELVAVLGANGAGKSTLMRALSGLHRPIDGAVLLLGRDITTYAAHGIAGAGLVLVPEGRQVFPELSVVDNIALGGFARSGFDAGAEVERMLTRFPALRERRDSRAGLLSGGEQQMLAIARGLVAGPKVLMLDEPSLGLAPVLINDLYAVLAELRDEGMTILLVDQMAALALSVADRGYVIESGRVVHEGSAEDIRNEPALERAYLGDFD
jgi:ABC-type branched-subunit amino acid transport system ATPase component